MRFFGRRRRTDFSPPGPGPSSQGQPECAPEAGVTTRPATQTDDGDAPVRPDRPAAANPKAPKRLTSTRVMNWLQGADLPFFVDSDGDLGAIHDSRTFYFLLFGTQREIFQVRGRWNRSLTIERSEQVLEFCNAWNAKMIWPKAYYRVRDDGQIHVYGEVAMDYEYGITDEQIGAMIVCGLQTNTQFFAELNKAFPDPAQVAP